MTRSAVTETIWQEFVSSVVTDVRRDWQGTTLNAWRKSDGSLVSELDLKVDATVRIALARYFPGISIVSEELGSLKSVTMTTDSRVTAVVDPVDGTESLLSGQMTWWTAVGLFEGSTPLAGLLYQPTTNIIHDSHRPGRTRCSEFTVGMSPNQLTGQGRLAVVERLRTRGARLVATPHASGKITAVLEGHCQAGIYVPSTKSPTWKSWDLAAGVAIATSNDLILRTFSGSDLRVHPEMKPSSDAWICAVDESAWHQVRESFRN